MTDLKKIQNVRLKKTEIFNDHQFSICIFFLSDNLITNTGYRTSIAIASILYHMGLMILLATGKKDGPYIYTCKYCTAVCDMSND